MAERLSGADAAWLHMDRPTNRMVINCVIWFDQPLNWQRVISRVQGRLVQAYPRFRQRIQEPLATLGPLAAPEWVEDRAFDLQSHIRRVQLVPPGNLSALRRYVGSQVPKPLPPDKPLWQLHLIDGYGAGSALLLRLHHAVADGIALVHLLLQLADRRGGHSQLSTALIAPPADISDQGEGPLAAIASLASAPAGALDQLRALGGMLLKDPSAILGAARTGRAAASSLRKLGLVPQDRTALLRRPLGVAKAVTWSKPISLEAVKAVGRATGATVNDVLLALIAGGLGTYLRGRGSEVEVVGAVVPFNVRPLDQPLARGLGNRFGLVFPTLPVGTADFAQRVEAVKRSMETIKLSRQAQVTYAWIATVGQFPLQVENALIDLYAGMGSVIITNVAGPARRLYLGGVPMAGSLLWVPASGPIGVGLSIVSYAGEVTLGLMVDKQVVPDPGRLLRALELEAGKLRRLASSASRGAAGGSRTARGGG